MPNPYLNYANPEDAFSKKPEDELPMGMRPPEPDQYGGSGGFSVPPALARPEDVHQSEPASAQETQTDSVVATTKEPQTTTTSPHTTQVVASPETKAAAADVKKADESTRKATEAKLKADSELERAATAAEQKRLDKEREQAVAEQKARQALEDRKAAQRAAADAAEAKADDDVKAAQNSAINWDDRSTGFKIIQAFIRAGSVRDSYILKDGDPMNNPVIRTLDGALADEKEKKQKKFLASKEWRDALKTKNAASIKETYEQGLAKIDLETSANARNLLLSEKTDNLVTKAAKNDPDGAAFKANRDLALADLDRRTAEAKARFEQHYDPTKTSGGSVTTSGGTTTTTTKKSVTKEGAGTDVVDMRTVYNADGSVRGLAPGTAKVSHDGVKTREMYAGLKPVRDGLGRLRDMVGQTDKWDRVPGAGMVTDNQKRIKGQLENMVAPITQFLGSGTPQEKEAKRRLDTLTVGLTQGKKISQENIDSLIQYIDDAYDAKVDSVVPMNKAVNKGTKPASPGAPGPKAEYEDMITKAKAAGDTALADRLTQEMNGH